MMLMMTALSSAAHHQQQQQQHQGWLSPLQLRCCSHQQAHCQLRQWLGSLLQQWQHQKQQQQQSRLGSATRWPQAACLKQMMIHQHSLKMGLLAQMLLLLWVWCQV
jgi:hypothetical protein